MPSNDARWIIGTVIVVGGLLAAQIAGVTVGLNARLDRIETDIRALDARVRAVEIALANVEQRLTNVEQRLTNVEQRLTNVEQRLTDVEQRLTTLERLHPPTPTPGD